MGLAAVLVATSFFFWGDRMTRRFIDIVTTYIADHIATKLSAIALWGAILATLYALSLINYLLFHLAAEMFSSVVTFSVFIMAYNTRQFHTKGFLNVLGVGFLSVTVLDVLHTLTYKGMGLFVGYGANLPTQLWLALRFVQSLTLIGALLFQNREVNFYHLLALYGGITALLVGMILGNILPIAYIEGVGLTSFKIASEYVIIGFLLTFIILLAIQRRELDSHVFHLLVASSLVAIASELMFTLYFGVYDTFNLIGHCLSLISFYLVYKAVIETGLRRPFALLFRDLKQSEEALRRNERVLRSVIGNVPVILFATDRQGLLTLLDGQELPDAFPTADAVGHMVDEVPNLPATCEDVERALAGETFASEVHLGEHITFYTTYSPLHDEMGQVTGMVAVATNLTEQRHAEEMDRRVALTARVREAEEGERRRLARELHDQVGGNLSALSLSLGVVKGLLPQTLLHSAPEEAIEILSSQLDSALDLVQQTTQSIRRVMADLRPAVLDEFGLAAALRWYGERFATRSGLTVNVEGRDLDPRPEVRVETELFRITQEALNNVTKHAQASRVTIELQQEDGRLSLSIADNGVGFDPAQVPDTSEKGGWGLVTMDERAEAVGGHLRIESQPGQGTRIIVDMECVIHVPAQELSTLAENSAAR